MQVRELIDFLKDLPPDLEVEMAIVAPTDEDESEITIDRYPVEGIYPWDDEETGEPVLWLIGGEEEDVDSFLDALDADEDDEDEIDH